MCASTPSRQARLTRLCCGRIPICNRAKRSWKAPSLRANRSPRRFVFWRHERRSSLLAASSPWTPDVWPDCKRTNGNRSASRVSRGAFLLVRQTTISHFPLVNSPKFPKFLPCEPDWNLICLRATRSYIKYETPYRSCRNTWRFPYIIRNHRSSNFCRARARCGHEESFG